MLAVFILIPLLGFVVSLIIPSNNEKRLSQVTFITAGIQLVSAVLLIAFWIYLRFSVLHAKELVIYRKVNYELLISLYFDKVTAVYLLVGAFLTFLITTYSRYYLHREKGYKRFFNTILFFYLGYNVTIFSGNFETLFIGWEILGISSFLLIAYYRDRYLPVKNAVKIFSIYRLGDICMILVMWMSHHLWRHNVNFYELDNYSKVDSTIHSHMYLGLFIAAMILVSAAVKSAQFPFSSWLPRAMEGPTPSSAIFYSSLSVHIGVFFLLRTYTFWEHIGAAKIMIGAVGGLTSILATLSGRVQSSIKSQIAYSSIAQIGIIFIEVAAGLEIIALIHFAGNAFLRTYQLLVSPSAVTYLIREQFYGFKTQPVKEESVWIKRFKYSVYVLSVREWNLDSMMFRALWNPFKTVGNKLSLLTTKIALLIFVSIFLQGCYLLVNEDLFANRRFLPFFFAAIGLVLMLKSFVERKSVLSAWLMIIFGHLWIALAVSFNEHFNFSEVMLYLSGVLLAGITGSFVIAKLRKKEQSLSLNRFNGHSYEYPKTALVFLLCCLGLAGFPITPTFLGIDLIFSHIHENQFLLAFIVSLNFIFCGLSIIRIYARVFLGPHVKTYHQLSNRSA